MSRINPTFGAIYTSALRKKLLRKEELDVLTNGSKLPEQYKDCSPTREEIKMLHKGHLTRRELKKEYRGYIA